MNKLFKTSIVLSALAIAACSQETPQELLLESQQLVDEGKFSAASIPLKNIIKVDPNNKEAREKLGIVYLKQGLYSAAHKELSRAQNSLSPLGLLALAEALIWLESYDEVEKLDGSNLSFDVQDELDLYKAIAIERSGGKLRSASRYAKLKESKVEKIAAVSGAFLAIQNGQSQAALAYVNDSIAIDNKFIPALKLKGPLEVINKNYDLAIQTFQELLRTRQNDYKIKLQLADTYIKGEQYSTAEPLVDQLLELSSNQPFFNELKGVIEYSKGDFSNTLIYLNKAINNGRGNQVTLLLAGISNYHLGKYEQAYKHINAINEVLPNDHFAHKLYSIIQLRLGYNEDAVETLDKIDNLYNSDSKYLVQSSLLLIQKGETDKAEEIVSKIDTSNISDPEALRSVNMLKALVDGSGVDELEKNYNEDPSSEEAFITLAFIYYNTQQPDKLKTLSENWIEKNGSSVVALNIKAQAYALADNDDMLDATYREIIEIEPNFVPASLYLIDKDIRNNNIESAERSLNRLIENIPSDMLVLMKNFQFQQKLGNETAAISPLEKAAKETNKISTMLLYAGALSEQNKTKIQLTYLKEIQSKADNEPKYWMMLADAYWTQRDYKNAKKSLTKWRDMEQSVKSYLTSVKIAESAKDYTFALTLIREAQSRFPMHNQIDLIEATILIDTGRYDDAEKVYNSLDKEIVSTPYGRMVKGKILVLNKEYEEAIPILKSVYADLLNSESASLVFTALLKNGNDDLAMDFANDHLKGDPQDNRIRLLVANQQLYSSPDDAITNYLYLVENDSTSSPLVLNNLAWLLSEQQKYAKALVYADEAQAILPENPSIMATRGEILTQLGRVEESVTVLSEAFSKSNESVDIGIDYASALIAANDTVEAQALLSKLQPRTKEQKANIEALKMRLN